MAALASSAALVLSGCDFDVYSLPLPGGADVGDNPYTVTVEFRDVLDLVPQSMVKVDDVTVGMVEEVELRGYTAQVTLQLHEDVELPGNAEAEIRQTSLLGEKFVSLKPPTTSRPSSTELQDGDVIPLSRSGNNPELEEVLGALSLILNGGGVGQLKIINKEVSTIFEGREGAAKSVLQQIRTFMTQVDGSKFEILRALENVNKLSKSVSANTETLDLALAELPSAIESIDSQRDDLVKMLRALADLSGIGVRVIKASKQGTIDSLNALAPILSNIDKAGDTFPRSLQVFLTYPFIDAVVGKTAQAARDLHMGDYTNLSVNLQVKPDAFLQAAGEESGGLIRIGDLCIDPRNPQRILETTQCEDGGGGGGSGPIPTDPNTGPGGIVDEVIPRRRNSPDRDGSGGLLGLGRAATADVEVTERRLATMGIDGELAGLLAWGVVPR
jgi:phospholipid/cholesterol/gamma-HCH transport system substrate-binding protein